MRAFFLMPSSPTYITPVTIAHSKRREDQGYSIIANMPRGRSTKLENSIFNNLWLGLEMTALISYSSYHKMGKSDFALRTAFRLRKIISNLRNDSIEGIMNRNQLEHCKLCSYQYCDIPLYEAILLKT